MSISVGDTTVSDGYKDMYTAIFTGINTGSLGSDSVGIVGSATKIVRVLRIGISGFQTTGSIIDLQLLKRSTASTGVVSGPTLTPVPFDPTSPAATASPVSYSGGVPGNLVGIIRAIKFNLPSASAIHTAPNDYIFDFEQKFSQAPVLRGTNELLALTFNGASISGIAMPLWIEWTEE